MSDGAVHEVDVVVLGLGPGGEHAAIKLARAGLDVVGIEERLVGGECPYFGCVPSKMMIAAADDLRAGWRIPDFAGSVEVRPDWAPVAARIREEATDDWDDKAAADRLAENGVTLVRGHGVITGPGRVEVDGTTYAARRGVVLNTGTAPAVPPVEGLDGTPYWTNHDAVALTELPASVVVLGGGPIGAELAQVFARFGTRVTVVEMADHLLPGDEPEAGEALEKVFADEGIQVLTGTAVEEVAYADGTFTLTVGDQQVSADKLLVASGRRTLVEGIGLDTVGATVEKGSVATDERMRAGEKLWAVGDITGKGAFTHVSMYQAAVAIRDLLDEDGPWADYRAVTRVTYTNPEVASVGLSEAKARERLPNVVVATGDLGARGWLAKEEGLVKVVADADRGILVGATAVGPCGGELIGLLALAVQAEIPVATLRESHYAYPTYYRAIETVVDDLDL
jgi:pyruvate/2-oxoglutarate dehydrogenase complex dihydrolipoamide dehydrogenase (E3) component